MKRSFTCTIRVGVLVNRETCSCTVFMVFPSRPGDIRTKAFRCGASLLRIAAISIVALALYVKIFERHLIYFPEREFVSLPPFPHEDVYFDSRDAIKLHGWFIPEPESQEVLIVSHGNAGNVSHRAEMGTFLRDEFRVNVLMYDYRGYGKSGGQPSEEGTYADIRGAYRYAQSRGFPPPAIYLLGQSLGSAVAVDLAAEAPVAGVLLEAPFTSIRAVAREVFFRLPIGVLLRTKYDSLAKVRRIRVPIAIVHAKDDPVLPYALGVELFEASNPPKRFFAVAGSIHEGALMGLGVEQLSRLRQFLFGHIHQ